MGTVNYGDLVGQAAEVQDYAPLPPGPYTVQVESAEVKQTKTGKVMYALTLKVVEGEHAGRKVWNNLVVSPESPQALGFFFRDMAALGADRAFFQGNPSEPDVCARIINARAVARVDLQKNDPTRNEVKSLSAATGGEAAPAAAPAAAPPSSPF
jgi:hypothetical protein